MYYDITQDPDYDTFYDRAYWYMTFAWLPHRCLRTRKMIWLCRAWKGTAFRIRQDRAIVEHKWMMPDAFLMERLQGDYGRRKNQ